MLWVVLLWLGSLCAAQAQTIALSPATPVIAVESSSRWWLDDSARASIEEVEEATDRLPWQVRRPGQQLNIDGRALWIRFDAQAEPPEHWYVELASSGLDRVQLFYRDAEGRWVVQEAGDTRAVSAWPLPGRVPTFALSAETGKPVRYWLRVEHARVNFAVPVTLYAQGQLLAAREREQFMLGAYFGLSALLTLVGAGNALAYRDRSFAVYAVYVAVLALGQAAYLGVSAQHLWDNALKWNEVSTFLLPGLSAAAALWFVRTVTEPARFSHALDLFVWSLILGLLSAVALDTWLASRATFGLQMALTALAVVTVAALIVLVWIQGEDPHIRLIALGFLPVLVMAVFPVLRGMNIIPNSFLTRYGVTLGAMLEMPVLFYALSLRGARRREGEARAAALLRSDALTGLANTRVLLQRLEAALMRARGLKHQAALLGVRISNFPAIGAEYGRDVPEKVLVVAASLLGRAISDVDLAARVGEYEFAALLEGPTTSATALSRAQQVVAAGLRQQTPLPAGLLLKFHVGFAMLPDEGMDAATSLRWVMQAVSEMDEDSRKTIRALNS